LVAVNDSEVPLYSDLHDSSYTELTGGVLQRSASGDYHGEV
jgi:hypothetical protein